MAGTVVASVVKNDTTSPPAFQNSAGTEIGQLCRAWANWNGVSGVSIRGSFNVSSITRTATGNYQVNFATAMPDANYSVNVTQQDVPAGTQGYKILGSTASSGTYKFDTAGVTVGAPYDSLYCCVAVFR